MEYKQTELENTVVIDIDGKTFAAARCRITDTVIKFMLISKVKTLQAMLDKSDIFPITVWDNRVKTFEGKVQYCFQGTAQYCFQKKNEFTFKPL